MWRSLSLRSSDASRPSRLALKIAAAAASVGVLVACSAQEPTASAPTGTVESSVPESTRSATPSTATGVTPTEVATTQPKIEKRTVVEIRTIPFKRTTVKDSSLKGVRRS